MGRILLVHWNAAEAAGRTESLRAAGYEVELFTPDSGTSLRRLRESPPSAFVIDLTRLPSQGRAVATMLRQQKATRLAPILFAGGEPDKVERTRALLPDAGYAAWEHVAAELSRMLKEPPKDVAVPDTMAGYSGTPLSKKLGLKPGATAALLGAPEGFDAKLAPLPEGVTLRRGGRGKARVVLLFATSRAELERRFSAAARTLEVNGALWVIWPKKTSALESDLTQQTVRAFGMASSFVDYKICAVDETWSGLCFARRTSKAGA